MQLVTIVLGISVATRVKIMESAENNAAYLVADRRNFDDSL